MFSLNIFIFQKHKNVIEYQALENIANVFVIFIFLKLEIMTGTIVSDNTIINKKNINFKNECSMDYYIKILLACH